MMKKIALWLALLLASLSPAAAQFADQATLATVSGGSGNAYTITIPNATSLASLKGVLIKWIPAFTNTAAATLNVSGVASGPFGATPILLPSVGVIQLPPAAVIVGQAAFAMYDGTEFILIPPRGPTETFFTGAIGDASGAGKTASWTFGQIQAAVSNLGGAPYYTQSITLSFNGATVGAGGMDTGSMPTAADLSIYAIYNPTTGVWALLGTNGSTSNGAVYSGLNMPSGYVASVLVSSVVTSGGNFPQFYQVNRTIFIGQSTVATGLTATSLTSQSLAFNLPANATTWTPSGAPTSGTGSIQVQNNTSAPTAQCQIPGGVTNKIYPGFAIPLSVAQTTYYEIAGGGTWTLYANAYTF